MRLARPRGEAAAYRLAEAELRARAVAVVRARARAVARARARARVMVRARERARKGHTGQGSRRRQTASPRRIASPRRETGLRQPWFASTRSELRRSRSPLASVAGKFQTSLHSKAATCVSVFVAPSTAFCKEERASGVVARCHISFSRREWSFERRVVSLPTSER